MPDLASVTQLPPHPSLTRPAPHSPALSTLPGLCLCPRCTRCLQGSSTSGSFPSLPRRLPFSFLSLPRGWSRKPPPLDTLGRPAMSPCSHHTWKMKLYSSPTGHHPTAPALGRQATGPCRLEASVQVAAGVVSPEASGENALRAPPQRLVEACNVGGSLACR